MRADEVTVVAGDTSGVSLGLGGFASRQTVTAGSSVQLAAQAVADKAKKLASHMLEAAEDDLELVDGEVRVVGAPQLAVKLGEIRAHPARRAGLRLSAGVDPGLEANVTFRIDALAYANACHVVEVEVDIETGERAHPALCRDAGFRRADQSDDRRGPGPRRHRPRHRQRPVRMDGLRRCRPAGDHDVRRLSAADRDRSADASRRSTRRSPSPLNPLGVKGVGEVGVIPAAAAIISAIEDALSPFDVRIAQMPVTPPKLVELIAQGATR